MRKARAIQLNVPVYKKVLLTVEEASDYSGFGVNKVRNLIKEKITAYTLRQTTAN